MDRTIATWRGALARSAHLLWVASASIGVAQGQQSVPFDAVATLSSDVVPIERSFEIAGNGQYRLILTDVGAGLVVPGPAPLESVYVVITRGQTVVATLDGEDEEHDDSPVDELTFEATAGSYVAHIVGKPGPDEGSGGVNLRIEPVASGNPVLVVSESLVPQETVHEDLRTYRAEIEITAATAGSYELTLADLEFPRALGNANVFVLRDGGLTACLSLDSQTQATCPASQTVALTAGRYTVFGAGELPQDESSDAGVFNVHFQAAGGGAVVHDSTIAIGRVRKIGPASFQLDAGQHTLSVKDLEFPDDLDTVGAIVTRAGAVAAQVDALHPDVTFTVAGNDTAYDVFSYATPDDTAGAGSYEVRIRDANNASVLSQIEAIGNEAGSSIAYTFPADVAAGNYRARLGDFQFPAALSSARLALVQNGTIVARTAPGDPGPTLSLDVPNLAAGNVIAIAVVRPATVGGNVQQSGGTFGIELTTNPGDQMVLDVTQGVGALIDVRKISVAQAGKYDLTLTDLDAPEAFRDLMAVISRGSQKLGTVLLGSSGPDPQGGTSRLLDFNATPGVYSVTIVAKPPEPVNASTYAISFAPSPVGPSVTLEATPRSVTSGGTTRITWSSQNATSCIASSSPAGVWSGSKAVSSSTGENSGVITAATTLTLKCTGEGGRTAEQSVELTLAAQSNNGGGGGGGGGAMGWWMLAALALTGLTRASGTLPRRRRLLWP